MEILRAFQSFLFFLFFHIVELELGSCLAQFEPLLSYGGPGECEGANYDDVSKSCASSLTIRDTMGDQGWPGV